MSILTEKLKNHIETHAMTTFPGEACGLIVSCGNKPRYIATKNQATNHDQFIISAEDYAAAEMQGEVVAVVHSHVNEAARPSAADLVACEATGLPWIIVSIHEDPDAGQPYASEWVEFSPSGYVAPLVGRPFHFGSLDCYGLVRDFYARELGVILEDFPRTDKFWERGEELYLSNFERAGFRQVNDGPKYGDVILMQYRSNITNHGAVFLGNEKLKERPDLIAVPDAMLHHVSNRLSERVIYGGFWQKITRAIVRHHSRV